MQKLQVRALCSGKAFLMCRPHARLQSHLQPRKLATPSRFCQKPPSCKLYDAGCWQVYCGKAKACRCDLLSPLSIPQLALRLKLWYLLGERTRWPAVDCKHSLDR